MKDYKSPQHEQIYGNKYGPPIGRPGNGLGDVWGSTGAVDPGEEGFLLGRRPRPNDSIPSLPREPRDGFHVEEPPNDAHEDLKLQISEALNQLTAKQAFVIGLRYGLRDGVEYTLADIADLMGMSLQAVARLEQRALERLKFVVTGG